MKSLSRKFNISSKIIIGLLLILISIFASIITLLIYNKIYNDLAKEEYKRIKDYEYVAVNKNLLLNSYHLISKALIHKSKSAFKDSFAIETKKFYETLDEFLAISDTKEEEFLVDSMKKACKNFEGVIDEKFYGIAFDKTLDPSTDVMDTSGIVMDSAAMIEFAYNENKSSVDVEALKSFDQELSLHVATFNLCINKFIKSIEKEADDAKKQFLNKTKYVKYVAFLILLISLILVIWFLRGIYKLIILPIRKMDDFVDKVSRGKYDESLPYIRNDELGNITQSLNKLLGNLSLTVGFVKDIEKGVYHTEFKSFGREDQLSSILIKLRESIKESNEQQELRNIDDNKRNWTAQGIARFSDILRQNLNIKELSYSIIKELVHYLNANQGGLFIYDDEDKHNPKLELTGAFAYDRRKYHQRTIQLGEGLVGTCALERETIYLSEIPTDYIEITSGLGTANPSAILIVPLKTEKRIMGVVEIASFRDFDRHEIEFVERIAESIASTVESAKVNSQTSILLEQSRQQAEQMAAQEEEMRQNLEELQATQEEAARQAAELEDTLDALNESLGVLDLDHQGNILNANAYILSCLEIGRERIIGKNHRDLLSHQDRNSRDYVDFWEDIAGGMSKIGERCYITESGKEVWFKETFKPIRNIDGEIHKIFGILSEISESKVQQQELKIQADKLSKIYEEMQERQKQVQSANEKLKANENILRKALEKSQEVEVELKMKNEQLEAQEEVMRKSVEELLDAQEEMRRKEDEIETAKNQIQENAENLKIAKEKSEELEENLKLKSSQLEQRESELSRQKYELENAKKLLSRTEQDIRDSHKMLQTIIDSIPVSLSWKDKNLGYIGCNRVFMQTINYQNIDELIGKSDFDLPWSHDAIELQKTDFEVIQTKTAKLNSEEKVEGAGGLSQWLKTNRVPLMDENGNVFGVVNVFWDVTNQKMQEEDLKHYLNELENAKKEIERIHNLEKEQSKSQLEKKSKVIRKIIKKFKQNEKQLQEALIKKELELKELKGE